MLLRGLDMAETVCKKTFRMECIGGMAILQVQRFLSIGRYPTHKHPVVIQRSEMDVVVSQELTPGSVNLGIMLKQSCALSVT